VNVRQNSRSSLASRQSAVRTVAHGPEHVSNAS
jgi:hypothetical protein